MDPATPYMFWCNTASINLKSFEFVNIPGCLCCQFFSFTKAALMRVATLRDLKPKVLEDLFQFMIKVVRTLELEMTNLISAISK